MPEHQILQKARKSNFSLLHSYVRVYLNCIRSFRFLYFILLLIKRMGKKKKRIGNGKIESFPFQSGDIVFEILTKTYISENRVFFCFFDFFPLFIVPTYEISAFYICLKFFLDSILRFICFSLHLLPKFLKVGCVNLSNF